MSDAISPVLDLIGTEGTVYFQHDFSAPWGMEIAGASRAQFHMVVSGDALVRNRDGSHIFLSSGDLVVFPTGSPHVISDSFSSPLRSGLDVVAAVSNHQPIFAEGGQSTRLICGHFNYDFSNRHPLVLELPDFIHLKSGEILGTETLISLLRLIVQETINSDFGSRTLVKHLANAVLVAILRHYISRKHPNQGFLAGMQDTRFARAIAEIHKSFPRSPTLKELAQVSCSSRSVIASVFKNALGYGPGQYATRWRLLNAAQMLENPNNSIEYVSFACGYQSPSSFSRAFRIFFGTPAKEYRRARYMDRPNLNS